jgi:hypothetical protein
MAWWIKVLEIADEKGNPAARFRLTAKSDEDGGGPYGLCKHKHRTRGVAAKCPIARKNAKKY